MVIEFHRHTLINNYRYIVNEIFTINRRRCIRSIWRYVLCFTLYYIMLCLCPLVPRLYLGTKHYIRNVRCLGLQRLRRITLMFDNYNNFMTNLICNSKRVNYIFSFQVNLWPSAYLKKKCFYIINTHYNIIIII